MGRNKIENKQEEKLRLTIRLKKFIIDDLRLIKGYNKIVAKLIENYLKNEK